LIGLVVYVPGLRRSHGEIKALIKLKAVIKVLLRPYLSLIKALIKLLRL